MGEKGNMTILLPFTHPQVVASIYVFLSSVIEDILKNSGKKTADGSH